MSTHNIWRGKKQKRGEEIRKKTDISFSLGSVCCQLAGSRLLGLLPPVGRRLLGLELARWQ